MRSSSRIAFSALATILMLLASCRPHQDQDDSAASLAKAALISHQQDTSKEVAGSLIQVWGYAAPTSSEAQGVGRNLLEASARADAQQMLTLATGVAFESGKKGARFSDGSMVSMVVREIRSTPAGCLVQAEGPVCPVIPDGMRKLRTTSGSAPLARLQFTHALLSAAKGVLDEAKSGDNGKPAGFLVLRSMELIEGREPLECRYELDVYAKQD